MRKHIDTALFIAALTAVLYSFTTVFYRAYFKVFSLDSDILERSFHQNLFDGLMLSFGHITITLVVLTTIFYFYSHEILPKYIDFVRKKWSLKRKIVALRRFWFGKRIQSAPEQQAKTHFRYLAVLTIIIISYLFSLSYFEQLGKEAGKKHLENHLTQSAALKVISVEIDGMKKSLTFLACGSRNCAGIEPQTNKVHYFPENTGFSFIYKPFQK